MTSFRSAGYSSDSNFNPVGRALKESSLMNRNLRRSSGASILKPQISILFYYAYVSSTIYVWPPIIHIHTIPYDIIDKERKGGFTYYASNL